MHSIYYIIFVLYRSQHEVQPGSAVGIRHSWVVRTIETKWVVVISCQAPSFWTDSRTLLTDSTPVGFIIAFHLLYYVCAVSLTAWSSTRHRSGYSSPNVQATPYHYLNGSTTHSHFPRSKRPMRTLLHFSLIDLEGTCPISLWRCLRASSCQIYRES